MDKTHARPMHHELRRDAAHVLEPANVALLVLVANRAAVAELPRPVAAYGSMPSSKRLPPNTSANSRLWHVSGESPIMAATSGE
jgi:hypothetical protein